MALVAEPFVLTFFTDKWAEAIPVMRAISIYALLFSLAYNAGSIYKAEGKPMLLTKLALIRAAMLMPALWWAATGPGTIAAIGWAHAAVALVAGTMKVIPGIHRSIRLSRNWKNSGQLSSALPSTCDQSCESVFTVSLKTGGR